jgi:hypothetical protein
LVNLGFDVISVKYMSTTHGSLTEETTVHISLFLITLPRTSKSHQILKLRSLNNIEIRVEAYKAQTSLTQCYNCGHIWANCKQPPHSTNVMWERPPAQGMPGNGQYSIDTDMLHLQVGGRRGTSSFHMSRL